MSRDFDLFQLSTAQQDTLTRALEAYQRALEHQAGLVDQAGDGGPIGTAWTAQELERIRQLLATFAGAGQ